MKFRIGFAVVLTIMVIVLVVRVFDQPQPMNSQLEMLAREANQAHDEYLDSLVVLAQTNWQAIYNLCDSPQMRKFLKSHRFSVGNIYIFSSYKRLVINCFSDPPNLNEWADIKYLKELAQVDTACFRYQLEEEIKKITERYRTQ